MQLLQKFEELFDGTLCNWKTNPVNFELKEGATPYHGWPFLVPQIHRETLKKGVRSYGKIGNIQIGGRVGVVIPIFRNSSIENNSSVHFEF